MAINLYGFNDLVSDLSLMVRADSREQAQTLFNEYIAIINETTLTDLQVTKEIPTGTLRVSDFQQEGIVNGGDKIGAFLDPNIQKALYINGNENSYVLTPSTAGNTPTGSFTFIVNAKSNNWVLSGAGFTVFLSKSTQGSDLTTQSYLFRVNAVFPRITTDIKADTGADGVSAVADFTPNTTTENLWFRVTYGETFIDQYISRDPPGTDPKKVVWTLLASEIVTPFTINEGTNDVSVGGQISTTGGSSGDFDGIIYRVLLINGTDPTAAPSMDMNPNEYESGSSWVTSLTSERWTLNGEAVVHVYDS